MQYDDNTNNSLAAETFVDEPVVSKSKIEYSKAFASDKHPFDLIEWRKADVLIKSARGEVVFEQKGVEIPAFWSDQAAQIVASKYFCGTLNTPERECSVRDMIYRVAHTICQSGVKFGYFDKVSAENLEWDLCHLIVHQMFTYNSPVWFNIGVSGRKQQASACFINGVVDTMDSIMELATTEAKVFQGGSGAGSNLSAIRGENEPLSGGGIASGPLSFMRGLDAFAGVIKSGGRTRRAAKMIILDVDHPDIEKFVVSKSIEEKKAKALIAAGYDAAFNAPGGAYESVFFQNANHSVRVSDEFMCAVEADSQWNLIGRYDGQVCKTVSAKALFRQIAEEAWASGDPGLQYDDTIHKMHTCKTAGRQVASNPCSEYLFLNDTSCNLASVNVKKFAKRINGKWYFDAKSYEACIKVMALTMDILVSHADYPTARIERESRKWRTLGIGFTNLGAMLMEMGIPYDSDRARSIAGVLCSCMTGVGYYVSTVLAEQLGPFDGYKSNEMSFDEVIGHHAKSNADLVESSKGFDDEVFGEAYHVATRAWSNVIPRGLAHGFRNAQMTVLAPTGTISFMMDCDTTGIEPDLALIKYKQLVGGGYMKLVNQCVQPALDNLGYTVEDQQTIIDHIDQNGTVEGCAVFNPQHLDVFDCALKPATGSRVISPDGHLNMMAACQPLISGAISKTINLPNEATVEDIESVYMRAWRLGLKAVALYRDGCKSSQPMNVSKVSDSKDSDEVVEEFVAPSADDLVISRGTRVPLTTTRQAIVHKFRVGGQEGYLTVGLYENGQPGEVFINMNKQGSTLNGAFDSLAVALSIGLQYGVPLKAFVEKFKHTSFEPSGITDNADIRFAKSITDYLARFLEGEFMGDAPKHIVYKPVSAAPSVSGDASLTGGSCAHCGGLLQQAGTCQVCISCGETTGCG